MVGTLTEGSYLASARWMRRASGGARCHALRPAGTSQSGADHSRPHLSGANIRPPPAPAYTAKLPGTLMESRLFRGRPVPRPPSLPSSGSPRLPAPRCSPHRVRPPSASLRRGRSGGSARLRVGLRSSPPPRSFGLPAPETAFSYLVSAPFVMAEGCRAFGDRQP